MAVALEIQKMRYGYRSDWKRAFVPVVIDLDCVVNEGEAFGFLGHNGAGKTTTIKCILNLCKIQSGSIRIFGQDHCKSSSRSLVGYLPEQPYFYDNLTVFESLHAYGSLAGMSDPLLVTRINSLLSRLTLIEKADKKIRTLSKGLLQRVGLAQAIIAQPKLLILDEPFSGLDPIGRKEFRDIILELKNEGTTIFMSSHILSDVETICDRASIMVRGEIKGIYDLRDLPAEIERRYEIVVVNKDNSQKVANLLSSVPDAVIKNEGSYTQVSLHGSNRAQEALTLLVDNKMEIQSFEPVGSSLESLFVNLVKGAQK